MAIRKLVGEFKPNLVGFMELSTLRCVSEL